MKRNSITMECRGCSKKIKVPYKPKGKERKRNGLVFMKYVDPGHMKCECKPKKRGRPRKDK